MGAANPARSKHKGLTLSKRPQPPPVTFSAASEYALEYRGRRFDTGQHCFRSPIISAPRFWRFAPQVHPLRLSSPSLSLSLSPSPSLPLSLFFFLSLSSSVSLSLSAFLPSEASLSKLGVSESALSSCHWAERIKVESTRDDMALRRAINARCFQKELGCPRRKLKGQLAKMASQLPSRVYAVSWSVTAHCREDYCAKCRERSFAIVSATSFSAYYIVFQVYVQYSPRDHIVE